MNSLIYCNIYYWNYINYIDYFISTKITTKVLNNFINNKLYIINYE